jgi:hypothetical protein
MEEERSFATRALVWPHDASRRLLSDSGTDNWFWIHVAGDRIYGAGSLGLSAAGQREQSRRSLAGEQFRLPEGSRLTTAGVYSSNRQPYRSTLKRFLDTG